MKKSGNNWGEVVGVGRSGKKWVGVGRNELLYVKVGGSEKKWN